LFRRTNASVDEMLSLKLEKRVVTLFQELTDVFAGAVKSTKGSTENECSFKQRFFLLDHNYY